MASRQIHLGAPPVIETARLRLEQWHDAHFERFSRFMRDPNATRYIRSSPLDPALALEQHERSLEEWERLGIGKRALIESDTDRWLGFVELSLVGPGKGSRPDDIEIGYFIEPSRWGEGFATEAAIATRDDAFDRCGIEELIGRCRVENAASARVLAKVGFELLRLFELDDGIIVEIHHLQSVDWTGLVGRHGSSTQRRTRTGGTDYRELG